MRRAKSGAKRGRPGRVKGSGGRTCIEAGAEACNGVDVLCMHEVGDGVGGWERC